jgi:hypothetical protein
MDVTLIIKFGTLAMELAAKYGIPAAVQIMKDLQTNPTLEDIEALKYRVPEPEVYVGG